MVDEIFASAKMGLEKIWASHGEEKTCGVGGRRGNR